MGVAVGEGAIVTGIVFGAVVGVGAAVRDAVGEEGWSPAVSMLVGWPATVGIAVLEGAVTTGGSVGDC